MVALLPLQLQELLQRRGVLESSGCPFPEDSSLARPEEGHRARGAKASQPRGPAAPPHAECELRVGPQPAGPAPGSVSGCTRPAVSGCTAGTSCGNVSAPGHSPSGPGWLPAPVPRGTHAAQVPPLLGSASCFPTRWGLWRQGSSPGETSTRTRGEGLGGGRGRAAAGVHSRVAHGHGLARLPRAELRDGAVLQVHVVKERRGCEGKAEPEGHTGAASPPGSCGPKGTGASPQALGVAAGIDQTRDPSLSTALPSGVGSTGHGAELGRVPLATETKCPPRRPGQKTSHPGSYHPQPVGDTTNMAGSTSSRPQRQPLL